MGGKSDFKENPKSDLDFDLKFVKIELRSGGVLKGLPRLQKRELQSVRIALSRIDDRDENKEVVVVNQSIGKTFIAHQELRSTFLDKDVDLMERNS